MTTLISKQERQKVNMKNNLKKMKKLLRSTKEENKEMHKIELKWPNLISKRREKD